MEVDFKQYLDKYVGIIQSADQIWFVAKDIFEMLDLSWRGADSLWQRQIPKEWTLLEDSQTLGGLQKTWFITERAVYKLAFRSNKPEAENFTNWVAEVIENIRKTGRYELTTKTKAEVLLETIQLIVEHEKKLQEHEKKIESHEARLLDIEAKIKTTNEDYFSLAGYYALQGKTWDLSLKDAQSLGKMLSKISQQQNMPVIKVHDSKYGEVNGYHKDILKIVLQF